MWRWLLPVGLVAFYVGLGFVLPAIAKLRTEPGPVVLSSALLVLGTILASNIEKKVGESVDLMEKEPFEIVGIYETANVVENGAMVVPLKELQRIWDRKGLVTGFSIIMDPGKKDAASIAAIRGRVEQLAPGLKAMSPRDLVNSTTEIQLAKGMARFST